MIINKSEVYANLVQKRKACNICHGLNNPSCIGNGIYDTDQIGPWSLWQGNLDADLMVIGQDWGGIEYFIENQGRESDNNPTNKTIRKLLCSIDMEISPSSQRNPKNNKIFMTNAILCIKEGGLSSDVKREWFDQCGTLFLKPLIDIVYPKVVVTLGEYAFNVFSRLYGLPKISLRDTVDQHEGTAIMDGVIYFPMYHCSPRVLSYNRKYEQQMIDWASIKEILKV